MTDKKKSIVYVVCAYLFFWIAFSLIGVVLMLMGDEAVWFQESSMFELMVTFSAWTPTIALLVLFKKLYPGEGVKGFFINAFRQRVNLKLLLFVTAIQLATFFSAVGILALTGEVSFRNLLDLSLSTIAMGFAWTLIQGPTGEQSGWRGFLQPHFEKSNGVIKSSILVGTIWGFWHTPLWFTSGYAGLELIQFITAYMIAIVSASVIIGICYNRCRNLFVPIWIHFMFNFTLTMFTGNVLNILTVVSALYMILAIGYIIWHKKSTERTQK